jgi:hypothetical protein
MNKFIRNTLHYSITLFVLFGNLMYHNCSYLQFHFYFCALIILHWLTNNNQCFLSQYDYKTNEYSLEILSWFGIHISRENYVLINIITYASITIPLLITYSKLKTLKCS